MDSATPRHPLYPLEQTLEYSRFLAKDSVDVVLAPEWLGLASRFAMQKDRAPLVTNIVTSSQQIRQLEARSLRGLSAELTQRVVERLERRQAEHSEGTIAISSAMKKWTERLWGPLPNCAVIPNGIDIAETRASANQGSLDWLDPMMSGGPLIVSTGRVSKWKGSLVLLEAMERVWEKEPAAQLLLVGGLSGTTGDEVQDIAAQHNSIMPNRVILAGHRPRVDTLAAVKRARVAVFASIFEGFGNGCLEALTLGVPTVATNGSGFDEFCESGVNALVVPPGRSARLGRAILQLLENEELAKALSEAAMAQAESFDSAAYAAAVESNLEQYA